MLFFQLDDFKIAFISMFPKSEELAASDHCFMAGRCLNVRLSKMIFLSLSLRTSSKSVLTGKEIQAWVIKLCLSEQLKSECIIWEALSFSGFQEHWVLPRLPSRDAIKIWKHLSTSTSSTDCCSPRRLNSYKVKAISEQNIPLEFLPLSGPLAVSPAMKEM